MASNELFLPSLGGHGGKSHVFAGWTLEGSMPPLCSILVWGLLQAHPPAPWTQDLRMSYSRKPNNQSGLYSRLGEMRSGHTWHF